MKGHYLEVDALGGHGDRLPVNYVRKGSRKQRGLEVVFDPKSHKDWVTGFKKRKDQRRKEAQKQLEKKAREDKTEQRAKKRKETKEALGITDDMLRDSSDEEEEPVLEDEGRRPDVRSYEVGEGVRATVTVTAIDDSDFEGSDHAGEEEGEEDWAGPSGSEEEEDGEGRGGAARHGPPPTRGGAKAGAGKAAGKPAAKKKGFKSGQVHKSKGGVKKSKKSKKSAKGGKGKGGKGNGGGKRR